MEFSLTRALLEDETFLETLYYDVRMPEFAPLELPAPMLQQLLAMQLQAQRAGYAAQFPNAEDKIIWIGKERAGRLLVNRTPTDILLVDVALLTSYRSQGVGGSLLRDLCEEARAKELPLRLTVRFDSPAARLYERLGFVRSGGDGLNVEMELSPDRLAVVQSAETAVTEHEESVEQGTTSRYFRTLIGKTLVARGQDGSIVDLVLEKVTTLGDRYKQHPAVQIGDSFSLEFRSPLSSVLPSGMAEVTPPSAAAMEIFLVPLGPKDDAMLYESVFNRMRV